MSDRPELVEALRSLSPKEFAEVVTEALDGFDPVGDANSRFVLALGDGSTHELALVCSADEPWDADAPLCQSGEHGGLHTISWAKNSICPLCGAEVSGT